LRGRRGISTPIASILMIVLIAEAVAFQTSIVAMNRDWQQAVEASNESARQRLAEGLVLENAVVSQNGNSVTLTFMNTGSVAAYVHHIWVISITDNAIHKSFTLGSLISVSPGATVTYNLYPSPDILDPAKQYYFKAVTTRGNVATIRFPSIETSSASSRAWSLAFIPNSFQSSTDSGLSWTTGQGPANKAKSAWYRITVVNTGDTPIIVSSSSTLGLYSAYTSVNVGSRLTKATIGGTTYTVDSTHPVTINPYIQVILGFTDTAGQGNLVSGDAGFVLGVFVSPQSTSPFYSQTLVIDAILFT
jgi:hypothetical protein